MAEEQEKQVRPFSEYLISTNRGRTHSDLSERMHDLVEEVLETGKAGTLTLKITVKCDEADARRLKLSEQVVCKLPVPVARESVFFADDTGNLTRQDPNQLDFGIAVVETPEKKAKRA